MSEEMSFDNLGINEALLRGGYSYGFEKPSSVQSKGIIPVVEGNDSIILKPLSFKILE